MAIQTSRDKELHNVLFELMEWGYPKEQLESLIVQKGLHGASPQVIKTELTRLFETVYGRYPEIEKAGTQRVFWAQAEPQHRARMAGSIGWNEQERGRPMPGPHEWDIFDEEAGERMFARQGANRAYPVRALMEGTHWLSGTRMTEEGNEVPVIKTPISPEKIAKYIQRTGAYESLYTYAPEDAERTSSGLPIQTRGGVGHGFGTPVHALIPLQEIFTSGQAIAQEGGNIAAFGSTTVPNISLPEGFEPQDVIKAGSVWDLQAGEKVVPFAGATPMSFGDWDLVTLAGKPQIGPGKKPGQQSMRMVFERQVDPARASASIDTALKSTVAFGNVAAMTGRRDVDLIAAMKDPLGLTYYHLQRTQPERLKELLGVDEQGQLKTWQEGGEALLQEFRTALEQGGLVTNQQYNFPVHESQLDKFADITQRATKLPATGMYQLLTKPIPSLDLDLQVPFRRSFNREGAFVPYREMERIRRVNPQLAREIQREGADTQARFADVYRAAAATEGFGAPPENVVQPTPEEVQQVLLQARQSAMVATGEEDFTNVPLDVFQRQVLQIASETWGKNALTFGGNEYLTSPWAMEYFTTEGDIEGREATRFGHRWVGAVQAYGEQGAPEAVQAGIQGALREQLIMASSGQFGRSMMGNYIRRTGSNPVYQSSPTLASNEVAMPTEAVLKAYGVKEEEAGEFIRLWEAGKITPTIMGTRFPTQGDEFAEMGLRVISPLERQEKNLELAEGTPLVANYDIIQAWAGDTDKDRALRKLTGHLRRTKGGGMSIQGGMSVASPEQVTAMAQRSLDWGAGLAAEIGQGPMTLGGVLAKLDPEQMNTYTAEELQDRLAKDLMLRHKIGPTYNILEAIETRAAQRGRSPQLASAQRLFGFGYGTAQRPQDLPPIPRRFVQSLSTLNPYTGGIWDEEGKALGKSFSAMMGSFLEQATEFVLPGSANPKTGAAVMSPEELAPLLETDESQRADIAAALTQWRDARATNDAKARGDAAWAVRQAMGGPNAFLRSDLGTAVSGMAYNRAVAMAERSAEGIEDEAERAKVLTKQEQGKAWLQNLSREGSLQPGDLEYVQAEARRQRVYRAMVNKYAPHEEDTEGRRKFLFKQFEGLVETNPALAAKLKLQMSGTESSSTTEPMPDMVDEETGEVVPLLQTRPAVSHAGRTAGGVEWETEEEAQAAEFFSNLGGDTPTAGGNGGRQGPPRPPSPPAAAAMPEEPQSKRGSANVEDAFSIVAGMLEKERSQKERMYGVSATKFGRATRSLEGALGTFEEMLPGISAGQPLSKKQRQMLRKLESWSNTVYSAIRQGGGLEESAGYWGSNSAAETYTRARELLANPVFGQLNALNERLTLEEVKAGLLDQETGGVQSWDLLRGLDEKGLQAIPGVGPRTAQVLTSYQHRMRGLNNYRGITSEEQLQKALRYSPGGQGLTAGTQSTAFEGIMGSITMSERDAQKQTDFTKSLEEWTKELKGSAQEILKHKDAVVELTKEWDKLSGIEKAALRSVGQQAGRLLSGRERLEEGVFGPQGQAAARLESNRPYFGAAQDVFDAIQGAQGKGEGAFDILKRASERGPAGRALAQFGEKAAGFGRNIGWNMFMMRRMWAFTGQPAFQAEQTAMQEELAAQQAGMAWSSGEALGPIGQGLLGVRSRQQLFQSQMGRSAYMGYGPIQEALGSRGGAEFLGLAGPAAGAGLTAGWAASRFMGPAGWGVGAAVGGLTFLGANYNAAQALAQDPNEMALRAYQVQQQGVLGAGLWRTIQLGGAGLSQAWELGQGRPETGNPITNFASRLGYGIGQFIQQQRGPAGVEMGARGQLISSGVIGAFEGDRGAQTATLREWARQQIEDKDKGSALTTDQLMSMAGEYQSIMGGVGDLNQIPIETLERAQMRGITMSGMAELSGQLGVSSQFAERLLKAVEGRPNEYQLTHALQQYAGAGQLGLVGEDWWERQVQAGTLEEMTGPQARRASQLWAGDRTLWSQYAAGGNLNLPQSAMEALGGVGRQPWMITTEPTTGLPLNTTSAQYYSGAYGGLSSTAAQGGLRGIQWAQMQNNFAAQIFQEQQQMNQMQLGYSYMTGQTMSGLGGTVSPGFQQLAGQYGGVWGLQDAQRNLANQWQMQQMGYREQMFGVQNAQWNTNWQANWDQFQVQRGWQDEQDTRTKERNTVSDAWWLRGWGYQENRAQLSYAWGMEDIDEAIRFSTGRDKLRLGRQKERMTISESMRRGYHEDEKEYWEKQKDWRDEDLDTAKDHRDQINEWKEEDLRRSKEQHDEIAGLQAGQFAKEREHYEEQRKLEDQQIRLEREYWKEQQKSQAESLTKQQEINKLNRQYQEDTWKLQTDAQDAIARFNLAINNLDNDAQGFVDTFDEAIRRWTTQFGGTTSSRGSTGRGIYDSPGVITLPNYDVTFPGSPTPEPPGQSVLPPEDSAPPDPDPIVRKWQGYAMGGTVPGVPNSAHIAVVHAGERIIRNQGGELVLEENEETLALLERIAVAIESSDGKIVVQMQSSGGIEKLTDRVYDATFAYG